MSSQPPDRATPQRGPSGPWRGLVLFGLAWLLCLQFASGRPIFDARVRHASSHWLWAGTPVDYTLSRGINAFRAVGANGDGHFCYSVGQQLLYIPVDVALYNAVPNRGPVDMPRHIWLANLVLFPLVGAAAAVAVHGALREVGHGERTAFWATLTTLAGSSIMAQQSLGLETGEELLYLSLGMVAAARMMRAAASGAVLACWGAVLMVCGLMVVLLRLPHLSYIAAWALFAIVATWRGGASLASLRGVAVRLAPLLAACAVAGVLAIAADRGVHFARFGEWTSNYNKMAEDLTRRYVPSLEEGYFFSYPWQTGLMLQLFGPSKSLFVYVPMLTLGLAFALWMRKAMPVAGDWPRGAVAMAAALGVLLLVQMLFYANYIFTFSIGHWGNRFVEAPATLLAALLAAGVGRRYVSLPVLARWVWACGVAACIVYGLLAGWLRPDADIMGHRMLEPVAREKTSIMSQLTYIAEQGYTPHLARRAAMVSHSLTGAPALTNPELLSKQAWLPNFWPWQMRAAGVGEARWATVAWALGWLALAMGFAAMAWRDARQWYVDAEWRR